MSEQFSLRYEASPPMHVIEFAITSPIFTQSVEKWQWINLEASVWESLPSATQMQLVTDAISIDAISDEAVLETWVSFMLLDGEPAIYVAYSPIGPTGYWSSQEPPKKRPV